MKVELELPDKPEVHYMAGALGIDADAVVGKLIRVWGWFDKHTEDGNATGVTFSLLDRISGVTGFAEQMELCGWLTQSGHVLTIPKFDHHNGKTAKNRALTAKRVAKSKGKSNAEGNAPIVTEALPREEKRRVTTSATTAIAFDGSSIKGITDEKIKLWHEAYPAVNLQTEVAKASAWLAANPKNRKSNIERFLTNWFCKSQDSAPRVTTGNPWDGAK